MVIHYPPWMTLLTVCHCYKCVLFVSLKMASSKLKVTESLKELLCPRLINSKQIFNVTWGRVLLLAFARSKSGYLEAAGLVKSLNSWSCKWKDISAVKSWSSLPSDTSPLPWEQLVPSENQLEKQLGTSTSKNYCWHHWIRAVAHCEWSDSNK